MRRASLLLTALGACVVATAACRERITLPAQEAPGAVSAQAFYVLDSNYRFAVSWTGVPGARGYRVFVHGTNGGSADVPGAAGELNFATFYDLAPPSPMTFSVAALFGPDGVGPETATVTARSLVAPLGSATARLLEGSVANGHYGFAMAEGDENADGLPDLVVTDWNGLDFTGVHLYLGTPAGLTTEEGYRAALFTQDKTGALAFVDMDGDGFADLVHGSRGFAGNDGNAAIFGGKDHFVPTLAHYLAPISNSEFGTAVATGDLNGDGFPELIIGAPATSTVYVYEGRANAVPSTSPSLILAGPAGSRFGAALATAHLDSAGRVDLAIGAPGADRLHVVRFKVAATLSTSQSWDFTGDAGGQLGAAIAAGHLDTNGLEDLAVGEPAALTPSVGAGARAGRVRTFLGAASGPIPVDVAGLPVGPANAAQFGASLAIGDIDGDGAGDLLVGAPGAGTAFLARGNASGTGATPFWSPADAPPQAGFGSVVAFLHDVNRDGRVDVAVSAPLENAGRGAVHLYLSASRTQPVVNAGAAQAISAGTTFAPALAAFDDEWEPYAAHACDWDFGDGVKAHLASCAPDTAAAGVTHVYATAGTYWTRLRVTSIEDGRFGEAIARVVVR